ncbi:hypothetical protein [Mycolicibacterium sp. HK-90]|uniref:hypothetical protein n=1 Tax=Mycolicibacterium sp. HK-90 TaxID=3056937 RepID=UPI002658DCD9|nr:hypothetical protein [Mycolicibacterium sp. HK-90]WKG02075.1 hypothetical protein QU592_23020 [Mycolicibacterium sp. HK-90]
MTRDPNGGPTLPRPARWWMVGVVAAIVLLAVAGVVIFVTGRSTSDGAPTFQRGDWQPPKQAVIASSMRERPIPGWSTRVTGLRLPDSAIVGTADEPVHSDPFVGAVGSSGYFLASSPGTPDRQWWLIGLDVRTGNQLFSPVSIDAGSRYPNCFVNGPEFVLCLADAVHGYTTETTAWVIDTRTGDLVFNGPTELHTTPGSGVTVVQVGIYAVAHLEDQGIYGVGPRADTTWSVPDVGVTRTQWSGDSTPSTLAAARDSAPGSDRMVVFSLVDGKTITPDLGEGRAPQTAVTYPGGFAIQAVTATHSSTPDKLMFFDEAGNPVGEKEVSGNLSTISAVLPVVEGLPSSTVFGAKGAGLIQFPDQQLGQNGRVIGHRLYAPESNWEGPVKVRRWHQFDLTTGEEGKTCRPNMSGYVANDGDVGVFETDRNEVTGATVFAMDLTTCEKLWTIPVNPDSFHRLWRMDDTLVELSDDGKELHSLVAPR